MTGEASDGSADLPGFPAYPRETVDRFFAEAQERRAHLLAEITAARHRTARAKAALAADAEGTDVRAVLYSQRALREEEQANARTIASVRAHAEERAAEILRAATDDALAARGHEYHQGDGLDADQRFPRSGGAPRPQMLPS